MIISSFNIADKLALINDYWNPRIVGELNGQYVKLAKLKGEFVWHKHDNEDEMFMVIKGELKIEFSNNHIILKENEICIVPKGTYHKPVAENEVSIMLFEPMTTINTGDVNNDLTRKNLEVL